MYSSTTTSPITATRRRGKRRTIAASSEFSTGRRIGALVRRRSAHRQTLARSRSDAKTIERSRTSEGPVAPNAQPGPCSGVRWFVQLEVCGTYVEHEAPAIRLGRRLLGQDFVVEEHVVICLR